MTLMTDAQALVELSRQAGSAADRSTSQAALDTVFERLEKAMPPVEPAVLSSPWWDELGGVERDTVQGAANRAAKAIESIVDAPDSVIASYGLNDDSTRGALAEISIAFGEFRKAVKEAQDSLLTRWANDLWPVERRAELEIHTFVPDSRDQAGSVLALSERLARDLDTSLLYSADGMQDLRESVIEATALADNLRELPVPHQVLELFRETFGDSEVPLSILTPEALRWLADHGASDLFMLRRAVR